jgi:hypothetical protein
MGQPVLLSLIGGPRDGEILHWLDFTPYEILLPEEELLGCLERINPFDTDFHGPVRQRVAVYQKVVDKNEYQYSGTRLH